MKFGGARGTAWILAVLLLAGSASCDQGREKLYEMYHERVSSVGDLNDDMLRRYVKTYRMLRAEGIGFQQRLAEDPDAGQEAFQRIEAIVKKGGFEDYAEFVKVNAKIAWAWNLAQADIGMQKQKKLNQWAQNATDDGIAQVEQAIADPNVPEETKAELRRTLAQLKKQKVTIDETWKKNKKWADWAMSMTKPLTNSKDRAVVMRHRRELMEVFTGLSKEQLDQIHDHSMRHLGIE